MIIFIVKRILQGIPTILGVMTISFFLMNIVPGDPVRAMVGDYYDDATVESLREELGLNKSLGAQYVNFISNVSSGNLGKSFMTQRLVIEDLKQKIKLAEGEFDLNQNEIRLIKETFPSIPEIKK